jgi:hypothetical protein
VPSFDRRYLTIPVIVGLWFLVQPGGYLARRHFFQLQRHPHGTATDEERAIAGVASDIAGRRVDVRCVDLTDPQPVEPLGRVHFVLGRPVDYMELRPDICTWLGRLRRDTAVGSCASSDQACFVRFVRTAEAVTAVAHESYHLRGVQNEAKTQCYALQRVVDTAERFGISRPTARLLARFELEVDYARLPPAYRTAECHAGGPLDLHTGSPWA